MKKILLTIIVVLSLFAPVNAQGQKVYEQGSTGRGLFVTAPGDSDLIKTYSLEKGGKLTEKLNLTNDFQTPTPTMIYPQVVNFNVEINGSPVFDLSSRPASTNPSSWIKITPDNYLLDHREIKEFVLEVNIPLDAESGTHTAMIIFPRSKTITADGSNAAVLIDQVGIPVFITVKGDINFDANIKSFVAKDSDNAVQTNFFTQNVYFQTTIENKGNIYVRPFGNIFIHQGDKTKSIGEIEFTPRVYNIINKDSSREFQHIYEVNPFINDQEKNWFSLNKYRFDKIFDFKFGTYYATYQARIRASDESGLSDKEKYIVTEKTVEFFVFPAQLFLIIPILVGLLVFAGYKIYKSRAGKKSVMKIR